MFVHTMRRRMRRVGMQLLLTVTFLVAVTLALLGGVTSYNGEGFAVGKTYSEGAQLAYSNPCPSCHSPKKPN